MRILRMTGPQRKVKEFILDLAAEPGAFRAGLGR
jgi:hypothetical protein